MEEWPPLHAVSTAAVSTLALYFKPLIFTHTYAATKAGLVAFNESIKQELKPAGITMLLMLTSGVKTEMYDDINNL